MKAFLIPALILPWALFIRCVYLISYPLLLGTGLSENFSEFAAVMISMMTGITLAVVTAFYLFEDMGG